MNAKSIILDILAIGRLRAAIAADENAPHGREWNGKKCQCPESAKGRQAAFESGRLQGMAEAINFLQGSESRLGEGMLSTALSEFIELAHKKASALAVKRARSRLAALELEKELVNA